MSKMIVVAEYTHGVAISEREATPADIAAAHPKCGSCAYVREFKDDGETLWHDCTSQKSLCGGEEVNPLTDYCPNHSELTK